MRCPSSLSISLSLSALVSLLALPSAAHAQNQTLVVTAIVTTPQMVSAFECWQMDAPFAVSTSAGTAGASTLQLGDLANATFTVLPPHFEGGVHNAPHPQWVAFTAGLALVTLPNGTDSAAVVGGSNGLIFAADTTGVGHNTSYISDSQTIAFQIPTAYGEIPPHTVLNKGPCLGPNIQMS